MERQQFEQLLTKCCEQLAQEARIKLFASSSAFEDRVRQVLDEHSDDRTQFVIDFHPPAQAFPDIVIGEYGIEVKFTTADTWRCIANSVQENQRVESVKYIYVVYGKMGGIPGVHWGDYGESIVHVRTSHVPRFEVEVLGDEAPHSKSLFSEMSITYDEFRKLDMSGKMRYIREYARKIHPDGRLWWIEDKEEHTVPLQARLYTKLPEEEKKRLRAEAALLCPMIVKSGRCRNKYDDMVLFLLTYHGVICHQARDLFSAGSVANPQNDDDGGIYIQRALQLLEAEMILAAQRMPMSLFVEYWNEEVEPSQRIKRWLEKADEYARDWVPSKTLFLKR